MANVYLTYEIKALIISALREIFARATDFTYNKNDPAAGSIIISNKYTDLAAEGQLPQVIVSSVGYSALNTFLGGNLQSEVAGDPSTNKVSQKKYTNVINFQITADCISTVKAECEAVADRVFNYITMDYVDLFQMLNLSILGIQVGDAVPREQYPQYRYSSTIGIQGSLFIGWTMEPVDNTTMLTNIQYQLENFNP